jgi:hypothetical protein
MKDDMNLLAKLSMLAQHLNGPPLRSPNSFWSQLKKHISICEHEAARDLMDQYKADIQRHIQHRQKDIQEIEEIQKWIQ